VEQHAGCTCAHLKRHGSRDNGAPQVCCRERTGYRPYESPELNLNHLYHMTDSTGIFQHASFTTPNLAEGYCTDDNARALILAVLLDQLEEAPKRVRALATTYAAFLDQAFDSTTKRFHNFLSSDRRWLDEQGSEDCHGRAIWRWAPRSGARRIGVRGEWPNDSSHRRCRR